MNNPSEARKHVFLRERGTCQGCGVISVLAMDFEVDHIRPLFEADGDLSFYAPENLQLLCSSCHKTKTQEDMIRWRARRDNP